MLELDVTRPSHRTPGYVPFLAVSRLTVLLFARRVAQWPQLTFSYRLRHRK